MQQEEREGPVMSRNTEEEDNMRKQEDASRESLKKKGGETRCEIDKTTNADAMEREEFQEKK